MRIAFISDEFSPFVQRSAKANYVTGLARELAQRGHQVCAVLPWPRGMDPEQYSLARRINPIECHLDEQRVSCTRYDGRTGDGIDVHLVEFDHQGMRSDLPAVDRQWCELMARCAWEVLGPAGETLDWVLSFDEAGALVPVVAREDKDPGRFAAQMMVVTGLDQVGETVPHGVAAADQVVVTDRLTSTRLQETEVEPLATMLREAKAVVLDRPATRRLDHRLAATKSSAKAALQLRYGLPVRPDLPLVAMPRDMGRQMARELDLLLQRDLQLMACEIDDLVAETATRFPDRFRSVAHQAWGDVLCAADAYIAGQDPDELTDALGLGTVPLAAPPQSALLVDLEPDLASGSGIVVEQATAKDFAAGLGRLVGSFQQTGSFQSLVQRLPRCTPSWPELARRYEQLMESLRR